MKSSVVVACQWEVDFQVRKRHIEASELEVAPNIFETDNLASAGIFSMDSIYNHVISTSRTTVPQPISCGLLCSHSIPAHVMVTHGPEGARLVPPAARNHFLPVANSHQQPTAFLEDGEIVDDQPGSIPAKKKRKSRRVTNDPLMMSSNGGIYVVGAVNTNKLTSLCPRKFSPLIGKGRAAFTITCLLPAVVPSSDIRQRYMGMWGNVFNLYDLPLLVSFLNKHTRGDVIMTKRFPFGGASLLSFPEKQEDLISIANKRQLLLHWAAVLLMSPDQVVRHDYVEIQSRFDGFEGSVIHCRLAVTGTLPFQSTQEEIMTTLSNRIATLANTDQATDEEFVQLLSSCTCPMLPVTASPGPLQVVGSFTFLLDSEKRIERMDYFIGPDLGDDNHQRYFDDSSPGEDSSSLSYSA